MKYRIYYNEQFDTLMLSIQEREILNTVIDNDFIILKNEDDIIGINILNISKKINIKTNYNPYDESLNLEVQKLVQKYIKLSYEPSFLIAKIEECKLIEKTHLNICKVNIGQKENIQIVCGAKNVEQGMNVVLATIGSWMPNGTQIQKGSLLKNESFGMLCSAKELNIEDPELNSEGIINLGTNYNDKIGLDFWKYYK